VIVAIQNFLSTQVWPQTLLWLWFLAPIFVPLISIEVAWHLWERYVRYAWISTRKTIVLEVKLPAETVKSPAAMEVVLSAFMQTGGEATSSDRYWKGNARPWASLEVAMINGEIHFYIWCFENQKDTITSHIYAQYPDVAVYEVEDYTKDVYQNRDKYDVWACDYEFTKPNPYPIKTYIDYGLSEDPDEEFKVDPLASFLETLNTVDKNDQIWFQFIVRAHRAEVGLFGWKFKDKWKDQALEEIQKIIDLASNERIEITESGKIVKTMTPVTAKMTTEKKDLIDALSRSIAKPPYDVGVRAIQVYPKGETGHIRRDIIKSAFRPFGSNNLNCLKPNDQDYSYWRQDPAYYFEFLQRFMVPRNKRRAEHTFRCYCLRSYFFYPYVPGPHAPWVPWGVKYHNFPILVMNTEELATLYHFPGSTAKAPALHRIPSKRSDAPTNLPT